jgi:dUTP pyrophosphatase
MSTVLNREDLKKLLQREPPLVEGLVDVEEQLQPNGIDLTLRQVSVMQTPGQLAFNNSRRVVSCQSPLVFDGLGFIQLAPGIYSITFNEVVNLPPDVMALATPRSSLLRCGVTVHTAVWDAGYSGRSESLLVVYHPQGIRLQRDARIIQLVFFRLTGQTQGYNGVYQGENIDQGG